ncbi:hypothetical protein D3C81_1274360 [compost metagenome]
MMIRRVADDVWIVEPVIVEALINPLNSPLVARMFPAASTVNTPLPTLIDEPTIAPLVNVELAILALLAVRRFAVKFPAMSNRNGALLKSAFPAAIPFVLIWTTLFPLPISIDTKLPNWPTTVSAAMPFAVIAVRAVEPPSVEITMPFDVSNTRSLASAVDWSTIPRVSYLTCVFESLISRTAAAANASNTSVRMRPPLNTDSTVRRLDSRSASICV